MTVYADILFLINFVMIFLILFFLRMFFKRKKSLWFCVFSAALASIFYELVMFFKPLAVFRNAAGFEALVFLTAFLAYLPKSLKEAVKDWGLVNLTCFGLGGVCSGVYFCITSGVLSEQGNMRVSLPLLGACCVFSYILIRLGVKLYENRLVRGREYFEVEVILGGRKACFKALGDTGNVLRDPLNGRGVIVGELEALKEILPNWDVLKNDPWQYAERQRGKLNLSLVPFRSLGAKDGILLCFLPDEIMIDGEPVYNAEIGLSPNRLSSDGSFKGLLNIDIMKGETALNVRGAA
ncbi:MAG: sigma-E processing peptidase SpoIIGA [Clostridiales bacterium]|nr:sigma-E processing peptidase SpoIIGA [Clostridiales bacterium]